MNLDLEQKRLIKQAIASEHSLEMLRLDLRVTYLRKLEAIIKKLDKEISRETNIPRFRNKMWIFGTKG